MRPNNGAAFSVETADGESLVVVQEVQRKHQNDLCADEVFSAIRAAVAEGHDLQLHAVVLLDSGSVLKTSSGKIKRQAMKEIGTRRRGRASFKPFPYRLIGRILRQQRCCRSDSASLSF